MRIRSSTRISVATLAVRCKTAPVTVSLDVGYGVNLILRLNYTASNVIMNMSDGLEGMWEGTFVGSLIKAFYQHLP